MSRSANDEDPQLGSPRALTRRQLLKLGLLGGGLLATGGLTRGIATAEGLLDGGKSVSRTTGSVRRAVASNCAYCLSRCSIFGFVEGDRAVKIEGNPTDPNTRGRLCARGQAGLNRLYDPDRILSPLQRTGRRGEGKWARLSWEQAYDVLEERMRAVQGAEPGSVVLHTGLEGPGLMARRFAAALGAAVLLDETEARYPARRLVNNLTFGSSSEVVDVSHARYVLNFGSNPYENHQAFVPFVQRLVDARIRGAKLVTFDPRMSLTAGRSDEWFPVRPGSDGMVVLAFANVIMEQGLFDQRFLSRWTNQSPDQLSQQLAPYTPERAEAASEVPAGEIRRLAAEFASSRPAVAFGGGGLEDSEGADDTQSGILLLNALVGSVGVQGGYCPAPSASLPEPDPVPPMLAGSGEASRILTEMLRGERTLSVYLAAQANPAYSSAYPEAFSKALSDESRVSYFVAIDTNLTETSMMADLILPAATYLESWGLETPVPYELSPFLSLRQPVVKPLGESLSVDDILLTAGTRLDQDRAQFFPFPNLESYLNAVASKVPALAKAGGLALLRDKGVWYDPADTPRFRPGSGEFATASGRLEFGQIGIGGDAPRLAAVTVLTAEMTEGDALTLVTYSPNVHFGDYSADSWWLSEISHENRLLIHPEAARQRRIKQGQRVRVASSTASTEVRVRITEGINPRVVALASGFGHTALGRVARAERFQSSDPATAHIWWQERGNGINASTLTEGSAHSYGIARTNTRVSVEAVG